MTGSLILSLLLLLLVYGACRIKMQLWRENGSLPLEPKPSPVSRALAELVAIAGGIYVSLVLLTAFLKMPVPERVVIAGLEVDPLAIVAVIIAIIQPYLARAWRGVRR
jgi:Ni,Fe-hydrogenase III small subunit